MNSYPDKLKVHDLAQLSRECNIESPWALPASAKKLRQATRVMRRKLKDGYKSEKSEKLRKKITKSDTVVDPAKIQRMHSKLCHIDLKRAIQFRERVMFIRSRT